MANKEFSYEERMEVLKDNGIEIPRACDAILMGSAEPVDISSLLWLSDDELGYEAIDNTICKDRMFETCSNNVYVWNPKSRFWSDRYLDADTRTVHWDMLERDGRLNRKRRKMIKMYVRNTRNKAKAQYDVFNSYVGRKDVVCVSSRVFGDWERYGAKIMKSPWYIQTVADGQDDTYCDIYCRIKEVGDE